MKILTVTLFILIIGLNEINGSLIPKNVNAIQLSGVPRAKLEEKLLNIVEEFKKRMCHPIPKFELPPLDPFELEFIEFAFIENFEITLADIKVKGLSDFEIPKLKISTLLLRFDGEIKLDHLSLTTNYTAKGEIPGFLDIDGKGQLSIEIDFGIDFSVALKTSSESKLSIAFRKLQPKLTIQKFRITGLFPDKELNDFIEDIVQDLGADLFDDVWNANSKTIIPILETIISAPISDLTPKDLLDLIGSDKPIFDDKDPPPNCKDSMFLQKLYPEVSLLTN